TPPRQRTPKRPQRPVDPQGRAHDPPRENPPRNAGRTHVARGWGVAAWLPATVRPPVRPPAQPAMVCASTAPPPDVALTDLVGPADTPDRGGPAPGRHPTDRPLRARGRRWRPG